MPGGLCRGRSARRAVGARSLGPGSRQDTEEHRSASPGGPENTSGENQKSGREGHTKQRGNHASLQQHDAALHEGPWVGGAAEWEMRLTGWADAFLEALGARLWSLGLVRRPKKSQKKKKNPHNKRVFSSKRPLLKGA